MRIGFALGLFCCMWTAQASDLTVDWRSVQPELLNYYRALVRIDTSNPPGNETRVVTYLRQALDGEHIPSRVFALTPRRANLVARLKGNGMKRPLILLGHTDVVGVDRDKWGVDPFAAILRNGWILGRGTIDDKSHVAVSLMTMILLHRMKTPLDRDVIFLAEAGEEGTTKWGIDFLVQQHWDDIAAEYALAEGGQITVHGDAVRFVEISTTEKVVRPVRLIAHGTSGHGSQPRLDNPIVHLAGRGGTARPLATAHASERDHTGVVRWAREDQRSRGCVSLRAHRRPGSDDGHPAVSGRTRNRQLRPSANFDCANDDQWRVSH
jgi:acetylornithine deacetylase/succinyl-diaminopimelate desuccinylase-like protein